MPHGYPPRVAAKLAVLNACLPSSLRSHSRLVDAFHYVDGFAGRGTYGEECPGSALAAMAALEARAMLAFLTLVEPDPVAFADLVATIAGPLERFVDPWITNATFETVAPEVLRRPVYQRYRRVATIAFVDLAGAEGDRNGDRNGDGGGNGGNGGEGPLGRRHLRPSDIAMLLRPPFSECMLFLGGDASAPAIERRERFVRALQEKAQIEFLVPFRVGARDDDRSREYVLHCSNHALAFKVMKEVVGSEAALSADAPEFAFLRDDEVGASMSLLRPRPDEARRAVLEELSKGDRPVSLFTDTWVRRSSDFLVGKDYRAMLRALEEEGRIEIVDPATRRVSPPGERMRGGVPTVAPRLLVRLRR